MTDDNPPTEKTTAEREAEARARARAEISKPAPDPPLRPGQPEVTRCRKVSGHRTLIVIFLSIALCIALALGGDHLLDRLKQRDKQENETTSPSSSSTISHERRNLGMDSNPFDLFEQNQQLPITQPASQPTVPLPTEPPTLNKAAALADQQNNAGETQQDRTTSGDLAATTSSCTSIMLKDETGHWHCSDAQTAQSQRERNNSGIANVTGVQRLGLDPDLYIPVDRYIPCSMLRRFVSDVGGTLSCLISEDVYSASNHVKLIPAGTLARGTYRTGALQHGQSRMFVIWTALRTPEPGSLHIPLTDTEVTGQLGEAGIAGRIDTHFWQRFGNALMLSTVQDVAAVAANSAPGKDRRTDYTENTRAASAEMAKVTLENSINIPPTMYLNQGDIIGIMTGTDIDFSSVYQLRLKKRWYER